MRPRRLHLAAVLAGLLTCSLGLGLFVASDLRRPGPVEVPGELCVQRGERLRTALQQLQMQGRLRHPGLLYLYARARRLAAVRSGCYQLRGSEAPLQLLTMLHAGQVALESFTLAEGLNRWAVRDLLVAGRWLTAEQFDALCDDAAFLAAHKVPGPSCEGFLFPETYKISHGLPPEDLFALMFANAQHTLAEVVRLGGRGPRQLNDRELMTLASIVEKETGAPQERPQIACVFYNRLAGEPAWRLDTDPTVIYAARLADARFDGNLTRAHLRHLESPYNTYRVLGLPPGPIANPGRAALQAVVQPAICKDFFFVSRNDGRHIFCPSIGCHNRAVKRWQVDYFSPRPRRRLPSSAPPARRDTGPAR